MGGSPSLFFILVFLFSPESLLYAWVSFQQKWVFLNIVLYEMNITLPSAELVSWACCLERLSRSSLGPPSILLPSSFSMPHTAGFPVPATGCPFPGGHAADVQRSPGAVQYPVRAGV